VFGNEIRNEPLVRHQAVREGAEIRKIRESEDLPLSLCLGRRQILKRVTLEDFFWLPSAKMKPTHKKIAGGFVENEITGNFGWNRAR
jgi:hypothetical protein